MFLPSSAPFFLSPRGIVVWFGREEEGVLNKNPFGWEGGLNPTPLSDREERRGEGEGESNPTSCALGGLNPTPFGFKWGGVNQTPFGF